MRWIFRCGDSVDEIFGGEGGYIPGSRSLSDCFEACEIASQDRSVYALVAIKNREACRGTDYTVGRRCRRRVSQVQRRANAAVLSLHCTLAQPQHHGSLINGHARLGVMARGLARWW